MRLQGASVYLTGGTGFIGGVVARRLREAGADVTCLVRPQTPARSLEALGARIVRGDVLDAGSLDLSGHDLLIHAAAWVGFGLPARKRPLLHRTNVGGTENVLKAAARDGVRKIVHVSSIAALGAPAGGGPIREDTPRPSHYKSDYERTKTEAHALALASGIPVAAPMPGLVVGLGGPFDWILDRLAKGKLPALPRDDAVKGWVHVEDTAEGILLAAQKGTGAYLLVDENVRATELFTAALEEAGLPLPRRRIPSRLLVGGAALVERAYNAAGRTPPVSRELMHAITVPMEYDSSRARKELGWRPDLAKRLARDLQTLAGRKPDV